MSKELEHLLKKSAELVREGAKNLEKEKFLFPEELFIELTYRCPQKCVMCDVWPRYLKEPALEKEEMTLAEIEALISDSRYLQKIYLAVLTGGEPFLRPDLVDICGLLIRKFPRISLGILSSFFDPENISAGLSDIYNRFHPCDLWLGTSLDGLESNHDRIRGITGSFERVMKTIAAVREKYPGQKIGVNFTILPSNHEDLPDVFDLCRKNELEFSAQFPVRWEKTPLFSWPDKALEEVDKSIRRIMEIRVKEGPAINLERRPLGDGEVELLTFLFYWQNLVPYRKDPRRILNPCPSGYRYAMFNPQGRVYFCPPLKHAVVGNIKSSDFDRVWTSSRANRLREKIKAAECHCWLNCSVYSFSRAALRSLE